MKKYRVPFTVDAAASATFFVEAASRSDAIVAACERLTQIGSRILRLESPDLADLLGAGTGCNRVSLGAVEEISEAIFAGEPTPAGADDVDSEFTPLELERYVAADGTVCPFCDTWDIDGGPIDVECGSAYQAITSNRCHGNWVDRSRLAPEGPYHVHRPERAIILAAREGETVAV